MKHRNKNVLIIGYGSIGQRHEKVLSNMGVNVYVYSRRKLEKKFIINNLEEILKKISFNYIIVANRTSEHYETLINLKNLNYKGVILIEKPIFDHHVKFSEFDLFEHIVVAYNLRLYPVIQELNKKISDQKILSVNAYAGQYLPQWRPQVDYRDSYSANKSLGGGVLLDLSHEIDYLNWMLKGCNEVIATGGKYSDLEIDSDDIFQISMKTNRCQLVQIELNYIDKLLRRYVIINTNNHTYKADLINSTLEIDGKTSTFDSYRNYSYEKQHELMLQKKYSMLCSYEESIQDMKIIDAIRLSNTQNSWVKVL